MTDYGLKELTDDQFLDLFQAMCQEACFRDRFVYDCAQRCVVEWAEQLKLAKEAMHEALTLAKSNYYAQVRQEVDTWVRQEIAAGEIQLVPSDVEAKLVVESTLQSKLSVIEEMLSRLTSGTCTERFTMQIRGGELTLNYGDGEFKVNSRHSLTNEDVRRMAATIRQNLQRA